MSTRGIVGGVLGGIAAAGAAGAVAFGAQQHRAVRRLKEEADTEPPRYPTQPSDRSGTVRATDGVALAYEEVGPLDAPLTVVFCHGYCLSMKEWWYQRRDLADRFGDEARLVFYDQRSHGRSGRSDPGHTTIAQVGRDLGSVLDARVPTGPVTLIGHSMGGMTIMAFADQRPKLFGSTGRVRGVAFIATSAGEMSRLTFGLPGILSRAEAPVLSATMKLLRWQGGLVERGRRVGADVAWTITQRLSFGDPAIDPATTQLVNDMIAATRIEVVADFFPSLLHHDKAGALVHLRDTDVEVVCGDHDLMLPLAHSRAIAAALPEATLNVIEGAGHLVVLERPDEVDAILSGLVQRSLQPAPKAVR